MHTPFQERSRGTFNPIGFEAKTTQRREGLSKANGDPSINCSLSFIPRTAKNFLDPLVTFQVMRRSLGTHLQAHGNSKDAQGTLLRHSSITTTGNAYVQVLQEDET